MRTSYALIAGLGLAVAACGPTQTSGGGMSSRPAASGIPTAGTGTISPIEGQNSVSPTRNTPGVPTAGTGTISPIQGLGSTPPRNPGRGVPSAGTGTISPIQGQSDVGQDNVTRP